MVATRLGPVAMGIYVVGMHRSGTSALTGMVSALTGHPASRLAVASNPHGQWERRELRPALDLMLGVNGYTWDHPPPPSDNLRVPRWLDGYTRRAFAKHCVEPFLWKDPRLCLTIDHWLRLPQHHAKVIVVHRAPGEVAVSLRSRNGWAVERGLALWERTNRNAVMRLAGREVLVVDHQRLLRDTAQVAAEIRTWLGLDPLPGVMEAAIATVRPSAPAPEEVVPHEFVPHEYVTDEIVPPAIAALADRFGSADGVRRLDLDGLPPESTTTAELLGSASTRDLGLTAVRTLKRLRNRSTPEVATAADRTEP